MHQRLKQVEDQLRKSEELRVAAVRGVEYGSSNVSMAEAAAEKARTHLNYALEYLRTEGSAALTRALSRSDEFGQQNKRMSEISQEARMLAQE